MKEIKELVDVALSDDDFLVGQKTTGETGKITKQDFLDSIISALSEPVGTMKAFAGATAPDGYFICDGSEKSRTTYATLFAIIGTTYGAGNGSTTFNIPNAQGITLKGAGNQLINGREKSAGALGDVQEDQMQGHYHLYTRAYMGDDNTMWHPNVTTGIATGNNNLTVTNSGAITDPRTDGTNGDPRTGLATRDSTIGTRFGITY